MDRALGALDGLVVLDATQMLAGPLAGTRLGDLGADVIKLEPPGRGEFNRTHGFEDIRVAGEMTTFLAVNRNKRSLALDLKRPEAREVLHRLLPTVDVILQNFRPQTAVRLGMDWESLQQINPRLVHCSISGYGPEGPYRDRPGQDLVVQGYSGSMFSVGAEGEAPSPGALWAADVMTGYQAVIGILAALAARERTGSGQKVDVDMLSVVLDAQAQELVTYLNAGAQPRRTAERTAHGSIPAPYGVYQTSDGWLTLAMCPLPALGEVLDDDVLRGYDHYNDGHSHRDEVYGRIRHRFTERTTDEWIALCDVHGVWAGPVYDYEGLEQDPHIRATGAFIDQPQGDTVIRTTRVPIRMSATPPDIRRGAPALGADSADVLRAAGFADDEVAALAATGVVGLPAGQPAVEVPA